MQSQDRAWGWSWTTWAALPVNGTSVGEQRAPMLPKCPKMMLVRVGGGLFEVEGHVYAFLICIQHITFHIRNNLSS
jgi:hypothetical protein